MVVHAVVHVGLMCFVSSSFCLDQTAVCLAGHPMVVDVYCTSVHVASF